MAECSEYNAEFMIRLFQADQADKFFPLTFYLVCYTIVGPSASMGIGSRAQIPKSTDAQIPCINWPKYTQPSTAGGPREPRDRGATWWSHLPLLALSPQVFEPKGCGLHRGKDKRGL